MKKFFITMMGVIIFLGGWSLLLAQNPTEPIVENGDTLVIQPTFNGNPLNALNEWILWDHDGSMDNPAKHTVYRLLRNMRYPITSNVTIPNERLTLVAYKPDKDNKPPQVGPADDLQGNRPGWSMMELHSITFKNIWFTLQNFISGSNTGSPTVANVWGDNTVNYVDGCYYEHIARWPVRNMGEGNSFYMTNCILRHGGDSGGWYRRGHFFISESNNVDTLVFNNSTFINSPGMVLNFMRKAVKYVEFDHNTIVNNELTGITIENWLNGKVTNNIFYNVFSAGQSEAEVRDSQGGLPSLINLDTLGRWFPLDSLLLAECPSCSVESNRVIEVANNWHGRTAGVEAYLENDAHNDTLHTVPWMNDRTAAMFADDTNYPYLTEVNTYTKDTHGFPDFVTPIVGTDSMVAHLINRIRGGAGPPWRWYWEPEGVENPNNDIEWPLLENLAIKNGRLLLGTDGYPIGDLNWYTDTAQRWDMTDWPSAISTATSTAVEENIGSLPESFSLEQNYPNPFNPVTSIRFSLRNTGKVKLSIYNMLGEEVNTLVDGHKTAGVYKVEWDGTNSAGQKMASGIYFYKLQMGSNVKTKKMVFLK